MSYDAESFKVGFALGRLLWKPPIIISNVQPGIGWTASPEYIIRNHEEIFATAPGSTRTPFVKTNNGQAICYIALDNNGTQWSGHWNSVFLISTNRDYAAFTCAGGTSLIGWVEYDYLDLHWYICASGGSPTWGHVTTIETTYPTYNYDGENISTINGTVLWEAPFREIMQRAGVVKTGGRT